MAWADRGIDGCGEWRKGRMCAAGLWEEWGKVWGRMETCFIGRFRGRMEKGVGRKKGGLCGRQVCWARWGRDGDKWGWAV